MFYKLLTRMSRTLTHYHSYTQKEKEKKIWEKRIEKKSVGSSLSCVVAEFIADNIFFFNDSGGGGASEREREKEGVPMVGATFFRDTAKKK